MKTKLRAAVAVAFAVSSLGGCASIIDGTTQEITVVSNPTGANCVFYRQDMPIGTVTNTPGMLTVKRRKYDITVKCDKPGYSQASYLNHSGTTAMIAGNIAADLILTAGISSIVDSANGADNRYDPVVNISMIPLITTAAAPIAAIPVVDVTPIAQTAGQAASNSPCTHDQQVQAKIARENGYTGGPKCD